MPTPTPLEIRKLADKSVRRDVRFDPETGERILVDPATGNPSSRPFLGVAIENDGGPPKYARISQRYALNAKIEGWIEIEGEKVVTRSQGPEEQPVSPENPPHVFVQGTALIFKTVDGDVRYKITQNPDKWPEKKVGEHGFGGEVDWTYHLRLEKQA